MAPAVGRGLDAIRLRAEVAGVASFLRAAREQAITQHRALEVGVDAEGRALVLTASRADPGGSDDVGDPAPLARVRIEADPPQARTVTFFAHGLSSGGRFRSRRRGRSVYLVTVDPLTGRVSTTRRRAS